MKYTPIPKTQFVPSALCLGSVDFGASIDRATSYQLMDSFLEHGG
ncbi:MAG: aldo/keto reductase, partial [Chloroflexi bacterium]